VPPWHFRAIDVQAAACPVRAALPVWSPSNEDDFVLPQQRHSKQTLGRGKRQVKSFALRPELFFARKNRPDAKIGRECAARAGRKMFDIEFLC
jgi:hypothetical protein